MPTCSTCKREYDNGTNSIHGCDPLDMLRDFRDAFGKLTTTDVFERIRDGEAALDLFELYARVRRMFIEIAEASPRPSSIDAALARIEAEYPALPMPSAAIPPEATPGHTCAPRGDGYDLACMGCLAMFWHERGRAGAVAPALGPSEEAAIERMVALVEGYQVLYAEACAILEDKEDVTAAELKRITDGERKLHDEVNARWPGDSGALPERAARSSRKEGE